jgi:hypothetical protein
MMTTSKNKEPGNKVSRRKALLNGAALSSIAFMPRSVLGGEGNTPPSDLLNIAMIGTGGRGLQHTREITREDDCRIVAVCDVSATNDYSSFYYRGKAGRLPALEMVNTRYESTDYPKCKEYLDYRKMLEQEKEIDACVIATPDHTHAVIAIDSMNLSKHVYCEKPLGQPGTQW